MAKLKDRLKLLRQETGLSQQDCAKQLGISKSSVNMYERGEREPGLETLEAIADYFNVDMDYLLGKSEFRNKYQWLMQNGQCEPMPPTISDADLKAAFYGGYEALTEAEIDELWEDAKDYAAFKAQQRMMKKN